MDDPQQLDPAQHALFAARAEVLFTDMHALATAARLPNMYVAAAAMTFALSAAKNHQQVDGLVSAFGQHAADRHAELDGFTIPHSQ